MWFTFYKKMIYYEISFPLTLIFKYVFCENFIINDVHTAKSAILIVRKKLKTSNNLPLSSNILLVRPISHFLLTKNLPKHNFA